MPTARPADPRDLGNALSDDLPEDVGDRAAVRVLLSWAAEIIDENIERDQLHGDPGRWFVLLAKYRTREQRRRDAECADRAARPAPAGASIAPDLSSREDTDRYAREQHERA